MPIPLSDGHHPVSEGHCSFGLLAGLQGGSVSIPKIHRTGSRNLGFEPDSGG